jgi:hypothetical protein
MHREILNGEMMWSLHLQLCKEGKQDPDKVATAASIAFLDFNKKSHNVFRYRSKHFDRPIEEGRQPDLRHLIITMDNQAPVLAASALFSVDFTEDGDIIGPTLNVVPLNDKQSVAVLSYPREQEAKVKEKLAKVFDADEKTLKYELAKLIVQYVDNFALSPAHYAKWSDERKTRVLREYEKPPAEIADHPDLNIFL